MCVIVMQPAGAELSGNKFRNCWSRNPDGGGFAFTNEAGLVVQKGYFDMKQMLDEYREARAKLPNSPFLLHFRIATVGPVDGDNTHPFWVRDDLVMAHNGTLSGFGDKTKSDSYDFAQTVLASLKPGWEEDETVGWLIEKAVGYNKIALLRSDGAVTILNEKKGEWVDGMWFSNSSYKKMRAFPAEPLVKGKIDLSPVAEVDLSFLGADCAYCDKKLDYWDCELCDEVQALIPICYDCIADYEEVLETNGIVAVDAYLDPQPPKTEALSKAGYLDNLFDLNSYWE